MCRHLTPPLADLYGYCFLVASVVAWSASASSLQATTAAEKLAEETGIAFQLTNSARCGEMRSAIRVYLH